MRIEARTLYRSNGLIDDFVVYGSQEDYLLLADLIGEAIDSKKATLMLEGSSISIQIIRDEAEVKLFTSLQNEKNEYYSLDEWNYRSILRVFGSANVLASLQAFLRDLSGRGEGYSYISEYSESIGYSSDSPEWRLHVEVD